MINIGKTIKRFRIETGMTQRHVARAVGVTPSYLSTIESGRREPRPQLLTCICEAMGIPEEIIFWEAVELPESLSLEDRRVCDIAKLIVRRYFEANCDKEKKR